MLRTHPCYESMQFLSTPSARRATFQMSYSSARLTYFYPRPPRGGRPAATISIHALREEGDQTAI